MCFRHKDTNNFIFSFIHASIFNIISYLCSRKIEKQHVRIDEIVRMKV